MKESFWGQLCELPPIASTNSTFLTKTTGYSQPIRQLLGALLLKGLRALDDFGQNGLHIFDFAQGRFTPEGEANQGIGRLWANAQCRHHMRRFQGSR